MTQSEVLVRLCDMYKQASEQRVDFDVFVRQHFLQLAANDQDALAKIPILDHTKLDSYPNNTIVRYTGMVQDLLNPEFFVSRFRNPGGEWISTNFTDTLPEQLDHHAEREFAERRVAYCTLPPGTAPWASAHQDAIKNNSDASEGASYAASGSVNARGDGGAAKRGRDDVDMGDEVGEEGEEGKRPTVDGDGGHDGDDAMRDATVTTADGPAQSHVPTSAAGDCMLFVRLATCQ